VTLGVDRSATEKEIKKAFRTKSLLCHPDKFPDDKKKETEFKNLSEAYQVLSHKKERDEYDQKNANSPSFNSGSPNSQNPFGRPDHETYNRFNKRYRPNDETRKHRTTSEFERGEDWHRIHKELNRRRYEAWEGRQADFSDFMHGRRGTDFKDFRKWYNEPASDFEQGGKNKTWADEYYEKKRHGSQDKMRDEFKSSQFQKFHMHHQRRVMEKKLRKTLVIVLIITMIHTFCLGLREEGLGPYAVQSGEGLRPSSSHDITVAEMVRRRVEEEKRIQIERDAENYRAYLERKGK
jgi:curved DNA-binding protein CbpA